MEQSFSSVVSTTSDNLSKLSSSLRGDVIGSQQYQRAITEITPLFQPRFLSSQTRSSPMELVRRRFGPPIAQIPSELLQSLPPPKATYSLWQGFQTRNEATLEGCQVRKELAASEIHEIDDQIARLKNLRKVAFDQVASIEQQEREIERRPLPAAESTSPSKVPANKRKERRKTQPTLQAFYAPGDRIKSLSAGDIVASLDFDVPFGVLAAAVGHSVQVWDLGTGELGTVHEVPASVRCVQLHGDEIVAGSSDANLRVLSAYSEEVHVLTGHLEPVTCVDWHTTIVTGSDDKTLRQWDPTTGKCIQVLDVLSASGGRSKHAAPHFYTPVWGPNAPVVGGIQHYASALAAGTADGTVRLWDMRQGTVVRTLPGHMGPITGVHFDGTQLVSSSLDRSVRIWDLRTSNVVDTWAYDEPVVSLHLDHSKVTCATGESVVHVYSRQTREHVNVGPGDADPDAASISAVCQKNGYLVEGSLDGAVGIWAC